MFDQKYLPIKLFPNPNYNLKHSNPYPINTYNGNNVATPFNLQPKPLAKLMIHELCPHILINNSQNTHKKKPQKKPKIQIRLIFADSPDCSHLNIIKLTIL